MTDGISSCLICLMNLLSPTFSSKIFVDALIDCRNSWYGVNFIILFSGIKLEHKIEDNYVDEVCRHEINFSLININIFRFKDTTSELSRKVTVNSFNRDVDESMISSTMRNDYDYEMI